MDRKIEKAIDSILTIMIIIADEVLKNQKTEENKKKEQMEDFKMAANVETMFSVREKPWHGLGTIVAEAPDSETALKLVGLDWNVIQKNILTTDGTVIDGFKANVRDSDDSVLGIVTGRYNVVQNQEAFAFTDALLGEEGMELEVLDTVMEVNHYLQQLNVDK